MSRFIGRTQDVQKVLKELKVKEVSEIWKTEEEFDNWCKGASNLTLWPETLLKGKHGLWEPTLLNNGWAVFHKVEQDAEGNPKCYSYSPPRNPQTKYYNGELLHNGFLTYRQNIKSDFLGDTEKIVATLLDKL